MKKILKIFLGLIFVSFYLSADNRIAFYLKKAPQDALNLAQMDLEKEKGIKKLENIDQKTPSQISNKMVKNEMKKYLQPDVSGFISLYGGYVDYSNKDGLISFPLRHTSPKLYLVVTQDIKLVNVRGNTISHLEFKSEKESPAKIYLFEKKEDKNKQYFWQVSEQGIPEDKLINKLSVVLLTNPKNIYVALGDFMSNDSKHIILPNNVYVVGIGGNNKLLLESLDIKRYFEPVEVEEQKVSDVLSKRLIINN
jgi:hypothetical protein